MVCFSKRSNNFHLSAFSDADWAGNLDDRSSTTAYIVYLGGNPISWKSAKQRTVARSSTEAEYRAIVHTTAELAWIRNLLSELQIRKISTPTVHCDNMRATNLSANPVFTQK